MIVIAIVTVKKFPKKKKQIWNVVNFDGSHKHWYPKYYKVISSGNLLLSKVWVNPSSSHAEHQRLFTMIMPSLIGV